MTNTGVTVSVGRTLLQGDLSYLNGESSLVNKAGKWWEDFAHQCVGSYIDVVKAILPLQLSHCGVHWYGIEFYISTGECRTIRGKVVLKSEI